MSRTQTICRDSWSSFFDDFSREYEGWQVTLEVESPDIGSQVEARDVPLQGISADVKGDERDVAIALGTEHSSIVTHFLSRVTQVRLIQSNRGVDQAVEVEAYGGEKAILTLCAALRYAHVDR